MRAAFINSQLASLKLTLSYLEHFSYVHLWCSFAANQITLSKSGKLRPCLYACLFLRIKMKIKIKNALFVFSEVC